ncbi:MAG: serine/threonine protein kinase, partial [Cyanobacteria bacterium RYN_339]|nr:serine/threonine protein kinase [Cyanobacteria bacterium RYN_339]
PPATPPSARPSAPAAIVVATLQGRILAPAGLVSNNGGGVISDAGASWKVLATSTQVPVANAAVTVLDAAGKPVLGADGKPVQARTDASGAYAITAALPARNLVLAVPLPGSGGAVQAIVAPGAKQVDGDVVSTLTTGYILSQYVQGQADPAATLDKLPADVEAATRARAASALAAGTLPDALTPAKVVAAVEGLRKQDKALDDQLEAVRRLLIPAGQSDLGNGQLALDVSISPGQLATAPDGTLVILENLGTRVWALRAGRLTTLAGSGGDRSATFGSVIDGVEAAKAQVAPLTIAYDASGRLVLGEEARLSRLGPDGKLHLVGTFSGGGRLLACGPGEGEELVAVLVTETSARCVAIAAGKPERLLKTFAGADLAYLLNQGEIGGIGQWDAHGRFWFSGFTEHDSSERRAFNVGTLAFEASEELPLGARTCYDAAGNRFVGDGKQITLTPALGAPRVVTTHFDEQNFFGGALAPDGTVYIAGQTRVFRVDAAGALTPVAGLAGIGKGDANAIAFARPVGVAVAPDGTLFVSDRDTGQIVRVGTDHQAHPYAGLPVEKIVGAPKDEGPALEVSLGFPSAPHLDAAGNLYVMADLTRVVKVTPTGQAITAYTPPAQPTDLAVAPDGTLYVAYNSGVPTVVRIPPGGSPTSILTDPAGDNQSDLQLAYGPDGTLYIAGVGKLRKWTAAGGLATAFVHEIFGYGVTMAADARGRLYVMAEGTNDFVRFDRGQTGEPTRVAGPGTSHFAGTGTDDGLSGPAGPALDAAGNLYFADSNHKQVKKIPAAEL